MLETLKVKLAGWSIKTFLGKQVRRGIRVAIGAVAAWAAGQGAEITPEAQAVVGGVVWQIAEAAASMGKLAAGKSDRFKWIGKLL